MIDERFIFVAVLLILIGDSTYLLDTIKGKVKPHKVTWFLWALAPFIAFAAQIDQEVGLSSYMTLALGIIPVSIFIASFLKKSAYWKITVFDLICGALALVGLLLWGITKIGNLAILFAVLADGLAGVPTVIKSFKAPETENYQVWLFNGAAAIITLLIIKEWDFAHYAFAVYMFFLALILFLLIKFKLGRRFS
ncbi:hypothetical protein HYU94_03975 [Candidatus Daviesbacteria bacterium]|nr:hypothetical protein [Candidatus Daviesbacteria bacterium]